MLRLQLIHKQFVGGPRFILVFIRLVRLGMEKNLHQQVIQQVAVWDLKLSRFISLLCQVISFKSVAKT